MEFSSKLQQLRASRGLTQEELAEQLFVSRTAVSKWESGRGCPSIDSLKAIAAFFSVSVDELLSGRELLIFAEETVKEKEKHFAGLFCGILDCLAILLLFLPLFGQETAGGMESVSLIALIKDAVWLKIGYLVLTGMTVLTGFAAVVTASLEKPELECRLMRYGVMLTIFSALLFVLSRQPYPGVFSVCCLVCKGYLLIKSK